MELILLFELEGVQSVAESVYECSRRKDFTDGEDREGRESSVV